MKQLAPIQSVDWLQINVQHPTELLWSFHLNYKVKNLDQGTRHFKLVQEISEGGRRVATVVSKPHSPLLDPRMMLIKFDNWILYSYDLAGYVNKFLTLNQLTFQNISRIDICADFQQFFNKMVPQNFINKFVRSTCIKFGKTPKFRAVGSQQGTVHVWESVKFGSNLSEISYYMYNKTKEMAEVKHKPWIAERWKNAGFDSTKNTWRLEFSIKSGAKSIINTETGETALLASLDILKKDVLNLYYNTLINHYFRFVWNDGQQKKSRMRELKLFSGEFAEYTIIDNKGLHDSTRSTKIFIRKLEEVNCELRGMSFDLALAADQLKKHMIHSRGIQAWAMHNNLS